MEAPHEEYTTEESLILTNLGFWWEQDAWCEASWFCDDNKKYPFISKHGYMIITKEQGTGFFKLYTNYGYNSDTGKESEDWDEFNCIESLAESFK